MTAVYIHLEIDAKQAPNTQSWWDAVCNCTKENRANIWNDKIISDTQYETYFQIRDTCLSDPISFTMSPDERFMFYCFMSYAFDPEQE